MYILQSCAASFYLIDFLNQFNGTVVSGSVRLCGPSYCHSSCGREQLWLASPAPALRLAALPGRLVQHPGAGEQLSRRPAAVRGRDVAEQRIQRQQQQQQRRRRRLQRLPASTCRPAAAPVPWTLLWCGLLWDGKVSDHTPNTETVRIPLNTDSVCRSVHLSSLRAEI